MTNYNPSGLLIVDKPAGMTSRDAVNRVQKLLPRRTRIGHAGTLDPLATGVLVLCVGLATRLTEYVQQMEKEYVTDIILGAVSSTDDADGEISAHPHAEIPSCDQIENALARLTGTISQVPPAYSAAKVTGRRAYDLARKGQQVQLQPRTVQVHKIDLLRYDFPNLSLRVRCGKGTYIRSMARDLGEFLSCGGYVQTLRRTRIGPFSAQRALALDKIDEALVKNLEPLERAVCELPALEVDADTGRRLRQGQKITLDRSTSVSLVRTSETLVLRELAVFCGGKLLAVARCDRAGKTLSPLKVLPDQESRS